MPFFYVALMSTRFFQSASLAQLRDALTDGQNPPDRDRPRLVKG